MTKKLVYSTRLTGAGFLLFELKQVLKLKEEGLTNKEIRKKTLDDNLFQYNSQSSINRAIPSVLSRADVFDETINELFVHSTVDESKVINLYTIMKTDLLFYEFMNEVIRIKIEDNNLFLENKDINIFFTEKAEQSEFVADLKEVTVERLKRAYMQVLFESGLLRTRQGKDLMPLLIEDDFRQHLIRIGDRKYLQAMGDDGEL